MTHAQDVRLLGPAEIRSLAAELDVRPTKKLGQNFVHDPNTVRRIVDLSGVGPGDVVLEVGPGLGSLTLGLLASGATVIAVEIDPVLAGRLPATVADRAGEVASRLTVIGADAMRVAAADLPAAPTAVVANLPYNVAVPVVLHLLAELPSLTSGMVMVQTEVADRMAAGPGSRVYGVPSVKLAWYGRTRKAAPVPRAVFWPVPNVDSALVSFERDGLRGESAALPSDSAGPSDGAGSSDGAESPDGAGPSDGAGEADPAVSDSGVSTVDRKAVFAAIDAAFAQRRKTLRAALAGWAGSAERAGELLTAAGIDPRTRGEQLTVDDFIRIAASR